MPDSLKSFIEELGFSLFVVETLAFLGFGLLLLGLSKAQPGWLPAFFSSLKKTGRRLAAGRFTPYALVAVVSLGLCLLLGTLRPPVPLIHDEFVYLMGGDTFAHGRLTNPTHPMWPHFESNHLLNVPTYAPKYPPGQALFVALGQVLTRRPVWGIYLSYAAAMVALFWMLAGWLARPWALTGALLTAVNGKMLKVWALGFMGGAVAMLGGALVFGALARLWRRWHGADAAAFAVGAVILLISRPFEGAVTLLPAGVLFLIALTRQSSGVGAWLAKALLPAALVGAGVAAIVYYNYRVTGKLGQLPYNLYNQTYELTRSFLFQPPFPKVPDAALRHPELDKFIHLEVAQHIYRRTLPGFLFGIWSKFEVFGRFFVGFTFLLPLVLFLQKRKVFMEKAAFATVGLVLLATFVCTFEHPHYLAPVACLLVLMLTGGLQILTEKKAWSLRTRQVLLGAVLLAHVSETALAAVKYVKATPTLPNYPGILAQLAAHPAPKHLVLVRYRPDHHYNEEWVYNLADIDGQRVVWAHAMGPNRNRALMRYFRDRKIWLLDADRDVGRLKALN